MRKLTLRHQWSGTGSGNCPAAYDVHDAGDYLGVVIQGKMTETLGTVWTPVDVIDRLGSLAPPVQLGEAAGYRVEGVKLVDLAELAQLVDLRPDESAVFVAADSGQ